MKRILLLLAIGMPMAVHAQTETVRPVAIVKADAVWAAHKTVKDQYSEGASGRKYDIMKCYAVTAAPAFKCVALDISGFAMDSGSASALNLPYMDEYFAHDAILARIIPEYAGAKIAPDDAMREIRFMLKVSSDTIEADAAKTTPSRGPSRKSASAQPAIIKPGESKSIHVAPGSTVNIEIPNPHG